MLSLHDPPRPGPSPLSMWSSQPRHPESEALQLHFRGGMKQWWGGGGAPPPGPAAWSPSAHVLAGEGTEWPTRCAQTELLACFVLPIHLRPEASADPLDPSTSEPGQLGSTRIALHRFCCLSSQAVGHLLSWCLGVTKTCSLWFRLTQGGEMNICRSRGSSQVFWHCRCCSRAAVGSSW